MMGDIGTYLRIWDRDGGHADVLVEHVQSVDAAVTQYVDSGRTRDTVLHLTITEGDEWTVLASELTSWLISTPEGRRASVERHAAFDEENKQFRHEAGIFDE